MDTYSARGKTTDQVLEDFEAGRMDADYGATGRVHAGIRRGCCCAGAETLGEGLGQSGSESLNL
jgi:hypothetical protein